MRETFVDGWVRTGDQLRINEGWVLCKLGTITLYPSPPYEADMPSFSFVDHIKVKLHHLLYTSLVYSDPSSQDTLKILGVQVSPVEIENTLLTRPNKLITRCVRRSAGAV
ncbi:hypothetical protein BDR05DRAFT_680270 [Suillus weaverae]|nr:hypothetical protein BDR05DRAFT_680270 [Suillus weaverae]